MATHEHIGLQTYKDSNGEKHLLYPVVKAECIADPENIPGFVTELELQNVENKIPTDTVTSAQLQAVDDKIPTDIDSALELLVDMELVEPITDENGFIITDENDNILSI